MRPIYHITHISNLKGMIADGCIWSDREVANADRDRVVIGYGHIKQRRLEELHVHCHPGTKVGDYVPFYFCPRSPMLFKINRRDADLTYSGGQDRIIHLVSSIKRAVKAAHDRPWAFSDNNAGAYYTQFSEDLSQLATFVNWDAVNARWWSGPGIDPAIMSKKMAEFLVHHSFPLTAFHQIGVISLEVASEVEAIVSEAGLEMDVVVKRDWYY
jgi:hypothetical protein